MKKLKKTFRKNFKNIRIKQRDRYSLEFKIRYILKRKHNKKSKYNVNLFLFFPSSFNINRNTFEKNNFYEDFKLYLRFDTPIFDSKDLLNRESHASPLVRMENLVERREKNKIPVPLDSFVYENKLLGCIYKSLLRDTTMYLRKKMPSEDIRRYVENMVNPTVEDLYKVAERYHSLRGKTDKAADSENLIGHCNLMDEHLSLLLERYLTTFLGHTDFRKRMDVFSKITKVVRREAKYRKSMGYSTVLEDDTDQRRQEEYIYREKMLKRYSSEVLFFDVRRLNKRKGTEHFFYALAAGVSMIFATAILFFGQTKFGSFTMPLFILLVVSYMLKDRIKDMFKDLFDNLGTHFTDRKIKLYDPRHHKKLAEVREKCFFINEDRLSDEIRKVRHQSDFQKTVADKSPEQIFFYNRTINLWGGIFRRIHARIRGLADISIIDLKGFFSHLARQRGTVPVFPDNRVFHMHPVQKIYHMTIIAQYQEDEKTHITKLRLIVNPKGIKRIEEDTSVLRD